MLLKSYADESWNSASSPYLTIGGLLMTDRQFLELDAAWGETLGSLPYFHMREGHYYKHPKVYKRLLDCLMTRGAVLAGFASSVDKRQYDHRSRVKRNGQALTYWRGTAYSFAVRTYMNLVGIWLQEKDFSTPPYVAYFFETGHANRGDAERIICDIVTDPQYYQQKMGWHYASHRFLDGKSPIGKVLQAGDILAWLVNKQHATGVMPDEMKDLVRAFPQNSFAYGIWDESNINHAFDKEAAHVSELYEQRNAIKEAHHAERKRLKESGQRTREYRVRN